MISTLYRVTIAGKAGTANAGTDGFIDPTTIEQYMASGTTPVSYAAAVSKERGNTRFKFLREQLQLEGNIYVEGFSAPAADANTAPTSFVFTAVVERGDSVLFTRDELNNGAELRGLPALTRMIARALTERREVVTDIYDPTLSTDDGTGSNLAKAPAARRGIRHETLVVEPLYATLPLAAASVTIVAL